ncbi:MAG TPA: type VI secretion system-associated FHA domain protein TagH [Stellaceae bacterium]
MSLVLTVVSYRGQPMAQPMSQRFEAPSITVGRSPDNDWTLPDPDQLISKRHCAIRQQGVRYSITDTSTNGVFINDAAQPVGNGQTMPLTDGDRLLLGHYEILVRLEGAQPGYAAAPASAFAAPQPMAPAPLPIGNADDPFGIDGFDFGQGPSSGMAPVAAAPSSGGAFGGGFPGAGNPFAAAPAAGSASGFAAPPSGTPAIPESPDWLLDPNPPTGELAADQYAQPDHLAAEHVHFEPPGVVPRSNIPTNWDPLADTAAPLIPPLRPPAPTMPSPPAEAGWPPAAPGPIAPGLGTPRALPEDVGFAVPGAIAPGSVAPEPGAVPPTPIPPPVATMAPARPGAAAAPTSGDGAALLAAFCQGAGIEPGALRDENPAELMMAVGQLFREMSAGLRDALATRAMIKQEYRVEQTVIRAANNNPLKFAVDVNQLLLALLSRARSGYLTGAPAVQEGFKDLRTHELALLGGMQAAVAALLRQFDPEMLKQRLEQQSLLQNLLPGARKAKYWEIYEQHYKQIAADVSEDVRGTFGRAFANAYEEQSRKL